MVAMIIIIIIINMSCKEVTTQLFTVVWLIIELEKKGSIEAYSYIRNTYDTLTSNSPVISLPLFISILLIIILWTKCIYR